MRAKELFALFLGVLVLAGCGGGGGGGNDVEPPPPVTVTVTPGSGNLEVGDTLQFSSEVNRGSYIVTGYVNDVQGGNATVGTITSGGLYTAPAAVPNPATVTVKAIPQEDTAKSDTSPVTVHPKMAVSPTAAVVPAEQTQQFTANKAATWSVNEVAGGNATVGTITSSGLYTAPPTVPSPATVIVKATWQLNTSKAATASVTITESSTVNIFPTFVTLAAGGAQQFDANIPVTWELSGASGNTRPLGTINSSGLYTAPSAPPLSGDVLVTAVSKADPSQKALAIVTVAFSNASLKGHYAFRLRGANGPEPHFVIGSFVADGTGGVSHGVFDFNDFSAPIANASFAATYSVGPDGRGMLNIQYGGDEIGWRLVMTSADSGRVNAFGGDDSGWGSLERQDPDSFPAGLSGSFAFACDGLTPTQNFLAAAGMFTANGAGSITGGIQDSRYDETLYENEAITGSNTSANSTTGRGQVTVTANSETTHYVYYMLSAESFVFSAMDNDRGLMGLAMRQSGGPYSKASLKDNLVFEFSGGMPESAPTQQVGAGRFTSDGNGVISNGVQDRVSYGTLVEAPFTGTYSINANGRGSAALPRTGATDYIYLYMISPQSAFFIGRDPWLVASGQIRAQDGAPFDASSINGTFGFGLRGTQLGASTVYSGQLTIDGEAGTISGIADINEAGTPTEGIEVTGTFTMSGNGRGVANLNFGYASSTLAIYIENGGALILIENNPAVPPKFGPAARQF